MNISKNVITFVCRYAIAISEKRSGTSQNVGWLDILANDTHEFYQPDDIYGNYSGPNIRVRIYDLVSIYIHTLLGRFFIHRMK